MATYNLNAGVHTDLFRTQSFSLNEYVNVFTINPADLNGNAGGPEEKNGFTDWSLQIDPDLGNDGPGNTPDDNDRITDVWTSETYNGPIQVTVDVGGGGGSGLPAKTITISPSGFSPAVTEAFDVFYRVDSSARDIGDLSRLTDDHVTLTVNNEGGDSDDLTPAAFNVQNFGQQDAFVDWAFVNTSGNPISDWTVTLKFEATDGGRLDESIEQLNTVQAANANVVSVDRANNGTELEIVLESANFNPTVSDGQVVQGNLQISNAALNGVEIQVLGGDLSVTGDYIEFG